MSDAQRRIKVGNIVNFFSPDSTKPLIDQAIEKCLHNHLSFEIKARRKLFNMISDINGSRDAKEIRAPKLYFNNKSDLEERVVYVTATA